MLFDDLTAQCGQWLSGKGPRSDIVISSRVRLARNLAAFPFMTKASRAQRMQLHRLCRENLTHLPDGENLRYIEIDKTDEMERQMLVERHLISKQLASGEGSRGVAITADEGLSVMVNEEDHLRLQVMRSGVQLRECWREADRLDDQLQEHLEYAFHERWGYLTACPTNVGTGMRVSVMMHLPALKLTGEIEKVFQSARDMHLAIRGLFGEGTDAVGDFYQISNQTTLGRSEEEILAEFCDTVIPRMIEAEMTSRAIMENERPLAVDDKIGRAIGILRNARLLTTEETLYLLSHLRLGVTMRRIAGLDINTINRLFLTVHPAHLQRILGQRLDGEARKAARADFVRRTLLPGNKPGMPGG